MTKLDWSYCRFDEFDRKVGRTIVRVQVRPMRDRLSPCGDAPIPATATVEGNQPPPMASANHAHVTSTKGELAQFHHQTLFSPPAATILKAIKNKQLRSFPGLEKELLRLTGLVAADEQ